MPSPRVTLIALASACQLLGTAGPAGAAAPAACSSEQRFHADLELDPTAYVLDGFSLHAGLGWRRLRLDLGVFGLTVPEFVHRQRDFDVAFDGYGVKLQYFPFAEQRGAFVGIDGAYSRSTIRLEGSQLSAEDHQFALGANAGVRIDLVGDLYLTPWLGVAYAFGADDVTLDGKTFSGRPLIIFPALHLGFRLR